MKCKTCKDRGKERVYEGESSRNLYLRSKEHVRDLKEEKEKSVMLKHINSEHEEEKENVEFEMKLVGVFHDTNFASLS